MKKNSVKSNYAAESQNKPVKAFFHLIINEFLAVGLTSSMIYAKIYSYLPSIINP
jgi:hypothetical protein